MFHQNEKGEGHYHNNVYVIILHSPVGFLARRFHKKIGIWLRCRCLSYTILYIETLCRRNALALKHSNKLNNKNGAVTNCPVRLQYDFFVADKSSNIYNLLLYTVGSETLCAERIPNSFCWINHWNRNIFLKIKNRTTLVPPTQSWNSKPSQRTNDSSVYISTNSSVMTHVISSKSK